ncbi:zinc finger protein OZF-like [Culex pipiens pallens]|uniref:zinc finger protein OZF-like n=1 Tax=Culex pipiens pallens TaxID=42434 RepID=UPI0022AA6323|nr:zinc finger protein OZF-like [Culex pipiens pallens]
MDLFANYCRLCRTENNPTDSEPLLTRSGYEKILLCTGVKIRVDDGLPQRICRQCEASLDQVDTFRQQCQESDAWWKETVGKPAPISSIFVKPEVAEEHGGDMEGALETVVKVEPAAFEFEDSDFEPTKDESSSDEWVNEPSFTRAKCKKVDKKFHCDQCSKQYAQKHSLDEHMARHSGIRNFWCSFCDSMFFTERNLKMHIDRKHTENQPFACDKCNRKFAYQRELVEHQIKHSDKKPFSCTLCSKTFKTNGSLKAHMNWSHQPEEVKAEVRKASQRICVCSYCGKVSTTVKTHKAHLRTHTGEQNYECNICNKRFSAFWSHRKHMLIHTDERPYQCEHCQKAFRQRHHLTTHIRGVHSNERPYQCRFCPKAFVTKQSMQFHEKTHGDAVDGLEGGL